MNNWLLFSGTLAFVSMILTGNISDGWRSEAAKISELHITNVALEKFVTWRIFHGASIGIFIFCTITLLLSNA